MIITCPNCNKQFKIDNSLIPDEGRDLQCGSCNHTWFYNFQEKNNEVLELKQEIFSKNIETKDPTKNPLMGWESSSDTLTEVKLEFSSKELAMNYAKKNNIDFEIVEPKKRKMVKKSYADNFLK